MIISRKHSFIFIKTKKTAGSSIEKFLINYLDPHTDICTGSKFDQTPQYGPYIKNGNHISASWVWHTYPDEWNRYFKFAVVRNPWDTMVSFYYWYKIARNAIIAQHSFDQFLECIDLDKFNDWHRYTLNNNIIVDKIIKYEHLHDEFSKIPVPYNGELLEVFVKNQYRQVKDYRELYNQHTKNKVAESFANVIDKFEYSF